ncbi:MAG: peptide-methionine (S)-S-oxide reductase MsrA [Burkholderiales bacterium]|nr:peptide-methionine (S)-S-oxide reductase MsrA [Burkholderiales bacterium]
MANESVTEVATLGGGCFWCLEAIFAELRGVHDVVSGYSGGKTENPDYESVCSGGTGHAEVVQVVFSPDIVSYREILEVFFSMHDPTQLNRQGNDVGTQYRSVVFTHSEMQREIAEATIREFGGQVMTQIAPAGKFYSAEKYHQRYFENNASQPYCRFVVQPKLLEFRRKFAEKLKA